jgi:hypothetical protein
VFPVLSFLSEVSKSSPGTLQVSDALENPDNKDWLLIVVVIFCQYKKSSESSYI